LASQKYLTRNHTIPGWAEKVTSLVKKIEECKHLKEAFRVNYHKIIHEMEDAGETPFKCSEKYPFERFDSFERQLDKICVVMEICLRYTVLDRIKIAGMEPFSERLKSAFKVISMKSYDPLAHRINEFEKDYITFQNEITAAEIDMKNFVKKYVEKI
jgi:hypothetical protein